MFHNALAQHALPQLQACLKQEELDSVFCNVLMRTNNVPRCSTTASWQSQLRGRAQTTRFKILKPRFNVLRCSTKAQIPSWRSQTWGWGRTWWSRSGPSAWSLCPDPWKERREDLLTSLCHSGPGKQKRFHSEMLILLKLKNEDVMQTHVSQLSFLSHISMSGWTSNDQIDNFLLIWDGPDTWRQFLGDFMVSSANITILFTVQNDRWTYACLRFYI